MPSILFECQHLYYLPQFRPVIAEMQRRGGFDLAASMPQTISRPEQEHFQAAIQSLGLEQISAPSEAERVAAIRQRAFDAVLVGNVGRLEEIAATDSLAVMVYHGIGLKASYYRDFSPRIDLLAVESEERLEEWRRRGVSQGVLTGMTKLDPLFSSPDISPEKLGQLGLDPARPTILYAPTFYPSSLLPALTPLAALAGEINIIIKLHQFSWTQRRYRHQSILTGEMARRSGMVLIGPDDYDIVPWYQAAAALVTDISSTLFEFLAVDRPIIRTTFTVRRLRHRLFPWRLRRRLDAERAAQVDFAALAERPAELGTVIKAELDRPNRLQAERTAARTRFLYHTDGKASARLVDAIVSRLEDPET